MNESILKSALCQLARAPLQKYVVIRHEDRFTDGIPDISVTGRGKTSWIEVKYANPKFQCRGIQELTMKRLALAGLAYFVVYWEQGKDKLTFIVDPTEIGNEVKTWAKFTRGFDHEWVIRFIQELHNDYDRP